MRVTTAFRLEDDVRLLWTALEHSPSHLSPEELATELRKHVTQDEEEKDQPLVGGVGTQQRGWKNGPNGPWTSTSRVIGAFDFFQGAKDLVVGLDGETIVWQLPC